MRIRNKEHKTVRASQIEAHPHNWRLHPQIQKDAMQRILDEVGFVGDVVVYEHEPGKYRMIDGHLRQDIADDEEIPVVVTDLTEAEARLVLATFDPLAAMAEKDGQVMAELEAIIAEDGIILNEIMTGEKPNLNNPDEIPPVDESKPAVTQTGDLWLLGEHRVLCGDSTSADDVGRLMDGAKADMVFTDPPYGVNYTGGAKKRDELKNDNIGTDIYRDSLCHLKVNAANHAALYLWYADGHAAAAAAAAAGYVIVAQIIWAKNHAQFVTSAHYKGKHEPCYYGHRKGKIAQWHGQNNEVTLWEYPRSPVNEFHPTQKPTILSERAIGNSSKTGQIILDLFLGSGSTLIAAEKINRKCYGLEIDQTYCDVICQRWADYTGKDPILERTGEAWSTLKAKRDKAA
jgi:DNA modification methylase